ncbi:MAG: hypothetical protein CL928_17260 [Deltaproteobacteria bacterium]|nr:hypothetical protein [Deltaproteobacteria bacterium]
MSPSSFAPVLALTLAAALLALPGTAKSQTCDDLDEDGFDDEACGGEDCDDDDETVYPGASELCDGEDSDCDGLDDGADLNVGTLPGSPATAAATPFSQIPDPAFISGAAVDSQDVNVGPAIIDDLDVTVYILHVAPEELEITLTSPSGTIVQLVAPGSTEGALNNLVDTVLDDEATDLVDSCSTPCTGSFQPNESLSSFDGEDPNGTWTIQVTDTEATFSNTSILNEWTLHFETLVTDDADQDGYVDGCEEFGGDCDGADPSVNPEAIDCPADAIDNDCDDIVDEGGDEDGDGYISDLCSLGDDCDDSDDEIHPGIDDDGDGANACDDCDDDDDSVFPGQIDVCDDGIDQDCSGEDLAPDSDGDGYTDINCAGGTDCDDQDPTLNPGIDADADGDHACVDCDDGSAIQGPSLPEECGDFVDNDCDGLVDNRDLDQDGYVSIDCTTGDDCDDDDDQVHPGIDADGDGASICDDCDESDPNLSPFASETCDDGIDQDCTGSDLLSDVDGDSASIPECGGDDCDDLDPANFPANSEVCDGQDNDCNGSADFISQEGDGGGEIDSDLDLSLDCADCDDTTASVYPGATELCNGIDDDCDATTGAGGDAQQEVDGDGDGQTPCEGDCDDTDATLHIDSTEICDLVDNNCDGTVDEGFIHDSDEDGESKVECGGADCDDSDPLVNSSATEDCQDEVDNNCDGAVDAEDDDCQANANSQVGCGCSVGADGHKGSLYPLTLIALGALVGRRRRPAL